MAIEILIPRLGWSMEEGTFGKWLKSDGDYVEVGDAIFTLESDKALHDIEAVDAGILRILPNGPREGDTVRVGALIGFLVEEGESAFTIESVAIAPPPASKQPEKVAGRMAETKAGRNTRTSLPAISPRAKRLATQLGIDWTVLKGSGKTGRIREQDIRAATAATAARPAGSVRRVIAQRMMRSVQTTAPVTLMRRVDATNLVGLRNQFKATQADDAPAFHEIIARLTVLALLGHPDMNWQWADGDIIVLDGIHIGIAVQTDAGLLVPVIRHCEKLNLGELTRRSRDLIDRARRRTCTAEELSGGTFSITNLGAFGIDAFTPILNTPETAILGLGAIRREAVVLEDDRIVPRDQMTLSLTFDHRMVDGVPAARFLQTLATSIENPGPYLME